MSWLKLSQFYGSSFNDVQGFCKHSSAPYIGFQLLVRGHVQSCKASSILTPIRGLELTMKSGHRRQDFSTPLNSTECTLKGKLEAPKRSTKKNYVPLEAWKPLLSTIAAGTKPKPWLSTNKNTSWAEL